MASVVGSVLASLQTASHLPSNAVPSCWYKQLTISVPRENGWRGSHQRTLYMPKTSLSLRFQCSAPKVALWSQPLVVTTL